MAKKVKGEDGKTYVMKEKKPFYKKVWFWILAVLLVCGVISSLGGGNDKKADSGVKKVTNTSSSSANEVSNEDSKEEEELQIGDTASIDGYEITVNSVDYSSGGEYSTPSEGKEYVIINITVKNNTDKKQSFNELDYSLNENGVSSNTGFTYVDNIDTLGSGDLDKGASVTGNLVGEALPDSKLKLRYEGNYFLSQHEVDFILR